MEQVKTARTTVEVQNHPEFIEFLPTYLAINDFVNGNLRLLRKYLRRYSTEPNNTAQGDAAYRARLERLYNENLCEPPLTIHIAHLSQEITLENDPPSLKPIVEDITGYGCKLDEFVRQIFYWYLANGRVGVYVDGTDSVSSQAVEAKAAGERSYSTLFKAHHIRYWKLFDDGPEKGKFQELVLQLPPNVKKGKGGKIEKYDRVQYIKMADDRQSYTWQKLECVEQGPLLDFVSGVAESIPRRYADPRDFVILDQAVVDQPEIPFVIIGEGPTDSNLKDVWQLNCATLNLGSTKSNIIYHQGFQRNLFVGAAAEEIKYLAENIAAVTSNPDAKVYTIEAGSPDAAFREQDILKNRARRIALIEFNQLLSENSKESPSAESKAKDMIARSKYYDNIVDLVETRVTQLLKYHAIFEGDDEADIKVAISRDYGLDDTMYELQADALVFQQAEQLGKPTVAKAVLKKYVRQMKIDEEDRDQLIADIDAEDKPQDLPAFQLPNLFNRQVRPPTVPPTSTPNVTPPPVPNVKQQQPPVSGPA